jgi:hypothetical protein
MGPSSQLEPLSKSFLFLLKIPSRGRQTITVDDAVRLKLA